MSVYEQTAETPSSTAGKAEKTKFVRPLKGHTKNTSVARFGDSSSSGYSEPDFVEAVYSEVEDLAPDSQNDSQISPTETTFVRPHNTSSRKRYPLLISFVLFFLLSGALATPLLLAFLAPSATVTLVPMKKSSASVQQITASLNAPSGRGGIKAWTVTDKEISSALVVATTGTQSTPPVAATGTITLSNNAPYDQTVVPGPGTLLTTKNGVQIQLDSVVTVPKGNPPHANGVATVSAHAVQLGSQGNILQGSVNSPCCSAGIEALNENAFSGGKDAQPFHVVRQSDIDGAVDVLKGPLSQHVQASLSAKLHPGEQLGMITSCSQEPNASPSLGNVSERVSITLTMNCTGIAYNQDVAKQHADLLAKEDAIKQLGKAYAYIPSTMQSLVGPATLVGTGGNAALSLSVRTQSSWMYQLNTHTLQQLLAGKHVHDARLLLSRYEGVQDFALSLNVPVPTPWWSSNTLPRTIDHITVIVKNDTRALPDSGIS